VVRAHGGNCDAPAVRETVLSSGIQP
jgi:hypothetical protein